MILTAMIWSYMTIVALVLGIGVYGILRKLLKTEYHSISLYWVTGLGCVTIYAEYFSLFYKVGALANGILLIFILLLLALERREIGGMLKVCRSLNWKIIVSNTLIVLLFLCIACQKATQADTDGYHAQAIRWIEEYGVVKGLGNLHNRLAYNSAFMCLQALFSGTFLLDQSTHVVNAYVACGMFLAAFNKLVFKGKGEKFQTSDWFRLALLIYICNLNSLAALSSPNTDNMALLFVLFILIKWTELLENGEKDNAIYGILCLLGVIAVSLKLSTIMILVLTIKPACGLIKKKEWNRIAILIGSGVFAIVPFLIRNVMISGYLLYPYSAIDIFPVDWKMAKSVVDFDRKEIMAYGKSLGSYFLSDASLWEWFLIWWKAQEWWLKAMVLTSILLLIIDSLKGLKKICFDKQKIDCDKGMLLLTTAMLFFFWLLSAPLPRYGMVFAFVIPCVVLGEWTEKLDKLPFRSIGVLVGLASIVMLGIWSGKKREDISLKRPSYYIARECKEVEWDGIVMYVAKENCYSGYYCFPATPYEGILKCIRLRTNDIKDGFCVKEEMKGIQFNNSGLVY